MAGSCKALCFACIAFTFLTADISESANKIDKANKEKGLLWHVQKESPAARSLILSPR
jgi:hypothetical protein